jgi:hypothetical protein
LKTPARRFAMRFQVELQKRLRRFFVPVTRSAVLQKKEKIKKNAITKPSSSVIQNRTKINTYGCHMSGLTATHTGYVLMVLTLIC